MKPAACCKDLPKYLKLTTDLTQCGSKLELQSLEVLQRSPGSKNLNYICSVQSLRVCVQAYAETILSPASLSYLSQNSEEKALLTLLSNRQANSITLSSSVNITFLIISKVVTDNQQSGDVTMYSVSPFQRSGLFCTHQNLSCHFWRALSHQCDVKIFLSGFLIKARLSLVSMCTRLYFGAESIVYNRIQTPLLQHGRASILRLPHLSPVTLFSSLFFVFVLKSQQLPCHNGLDKLDIEVEISVSTETLPNGSCYKNSNNPFLCCLISKTCDLKGREYIVGRGISIFQINHECMGPGGSWSKSICIRRKGI